MDENLLKENIYYKFENNTNNEILKYTQFDWGRLTFWGLENLFVENILF